MHVCICARPFDSDRCKVGIHIALTVSTYREHVCIETDLRYRFAAAGPVVWSLVVCPYGWLSKHVHPCLVRLMQTTCRGHWLELQSGIQQRENDSLLYARVLRVRAA